MAEESTATQTAATTDADGRDFAFGDTPTTPRHFVVLGGSPVDAPTLLLLEARLAIVPRSDGCALYMDGHPIALACSALEAAADIEAMLDAMDAKAASLAEQSMLRARGGCSCLEDMRRGVPPSPAGEPMAVGPTPTPGPAC